MLGVDLTAVPGFAASTALAGGKIYSVKPSEVKGRMAEALRLAAQSLCRAFNPEVFQIEEGKMKRKKVARLQYLATALNYQLIPNQ